MGGTEETMTKACNNEQQDGVTNFKLGRTVLGFAFTLIYIMLLSAPADAFDGKLKGFVAGFGLGAAPTAHWSSSQVAEDITETGYAGEMLIGYAWDDNNVLVYDGSGAMYYHTDVDRVWIMQGIDAVRWYHYWGNQKHRYFTAAGLGAFFLGTNYCNVYGEGIGYSLGVGREVFKQVQAGLYVMGGHTSNSYGVKANHFVVSLLVTIVAY